MTVVLIHIEQGSYAWDQINTSIWHSRVNKCLFVKYRMGSYECLVKIHLWE